jgi:hypothetical protein
MADTVKLDSIVTASAAPTFRPVDPLLEPKECRESLEDWRLDARCPYASTQHAGASVVVSSLVGFTLSWPLPALAGAK